MPFKPLSSSNSDETNLAQMNDMLRELYARDTVQIFKDDTGQRRVLLGKRGDDYGLFVSKATFDVFNASNDDLVFNSGQNVFKIVDSGTIVSPAISVSNPGAGNFDSGSATTTVSHSLGYIPAVIGYITGGASTYFPLPFHSVSGASTSCRWFTLYTIASDTDVVFQIDVTVYNQAFSLTGGEYTLNFYLLQESAN